MLENGIKGKVALITGSSRGIGFSTAKLLHELGATVILNSNSDEAELKNASEKLANSKYYKCDITRENDVKQMIEDVVKTQGKIDLLVNNAGGGDRGWGGVMDSDEEWNISYALNLMGAVHLCRYVIPHMKTGAIVNISSLWGIAHTAKPSIATYCVSKAALSKLTELLAREYAPNIRVNAVAPGWTETKLLEDNMDASAMDFMKRNTLLNRTAKPEEIANVVVFLLSNLSSYITGQIISADGGYTLAREQID